MGQKQTTTPDCGGRIQAPCKYGKAASEAAAASAAASEAEAAPTAWQKQLKIEKAKNNTKN